MRAERITLADWYESGRTDTLELGVGSDIVTVGFPGAERPDGGCPSVWFEVQTHDTGNAADPRPLRHLAYVDLDGDGEYDLVIDFDRGSVGHEKEI